MAALRLKALGHYSVREILQIVQFSRKTFNRAQRRYRLTGTVAKAQVIGRGRPRKALHEDVQYLIRLAHHKPTLFLDEYQRRLKVYRLLSLSMATIHRELQRAGLSTKRVQKMAAERDPMKRADFVRRISQYPATYLLPLDEVSKDDRTYARLWGRSEVGTRVEACQPFVRKRRFSMLATMALDEGIIAAQVVEGSFTRDLFLKYLRDDLVCHIPTIPIRVSYCSILQLPITSPYPGPWSVLVMDNARIHHHDDITELVESYGEKTAVSEPGTVLTDRQAVASNIFHPIPPITTPLNQPFLQSKPIFVAKVSTFTMRKLFILSSTMPVHALRQR